MTDQEFADFCSQHPGLSFETTADGEIVVMPPNFSKTGARNLEICMQLGIWARKDGSGVANDSSTGYVLPNGAALAGCVLDAESRNPEARDRKSRRILAFMSRICDRTSLSF